MEIAISTCKAKILQIIKVPTGHVCIMNGKRGKLEFLSLSDYGKVKNVKADFLGYHDEINGVSHGQMLPLEEKWVITISSQYGCSIGCKFCDVPVVGPGINATYHDIVSQVACAISLHPEVKFTRRLNLHYARMGEPTFNYTLITATLFLAKHFKSLGWGFHPVVSTVCPANNTCIKEFIRDWITLKNYTMEGNAGLQISVNSTSEKERAFLFNGNAMPLPEIGKMLHTILNNTGLKGRKIALNFAVSTGYEIDGKKLRECFDPEYFMCKLTPMHVTRSCLENNLLTEDGYETYQPYKTIEEDLKRHGFDVLVFVPSLEEEKGKITCGNAILSGNMPEIYEEMNVGDVIEKENEN